MPRRATTRSEHQYRIPGHPGYLITKSGVIWSHKRVTPKRLSIRINRFNRSHFRVVGLTHGVANSSVSYPIYRLLAETFIRNPKRLLAVGHKNLNPLDDRLANLHWTRVKEITYKASKARAYANAAGRKKLSDGKVRAIRRLYNQDVPTVEISRRLRISVHVALNAAKKRTYAHVR